MNTHYFVLTCAMTLLVHSMNCWYAYENTSTEICLCANTSRIAQAMECIRFLIQTCVDILVSTLKSPCLRVKIEVSLYRIYEMQRSKIRRLHNRKNNKPYVPTRPDQENLLPLLAVGEPSCPHPCLVGLTGQA